MAPSSSTRARDSTAGPPARASLPGRSLAVLWSAPPEPDLAMPKPKTPPVKPVYIALVCVVAVAAMFIGSIVISVAVVKAERAQPAPASQAE